MLTIDLLIALLHELRRQILELIAMIDKELELYAASVQDDAWLLNNYGVIGG